MNKVVSFKKKKNLAFISNNTNFFFNTKTKNDLLDRYHLRKQTGKQTELKGLGGSSVRPRSGLRILFR